MLNVRDGDDFKVVDKTPVYCVMRYNLSSNKVFFHAATM